MNIDRYMERARRKRLWLRAKVVASACGVGLVFFLLVAGVFG